MVVSLKAHTFCIWIDGAPNLVFECNFTGAWATVSQECSEIPSIATLAMLVLNLSFSQQLR